MGTPTGSWIIPVSAAALLLIVVAVIVLRYLLTPRITAPLCARCRYDVTGLPSDVCPECGANLNEVGILQPGSVKPMGSGMKVALWTLSVAATAVIVTPPILRSVPPLKQTSMQQTLAAPGSRLYKSVLVDSSRRWRNDPKSAKVEVTLTLTRLDGQRYELAVIPDSNQCRYIDATGQKHRENLPISDHEAAAKTLVKWLDSCGIAATGDTLNREAGEIAKNIDEAVNTPAQQRFGFTTMSSSSFSTGSFGSFNGMSIRSAPFSSTAMQMNSGQIPDPWPLRYAIGGWIGLWLLGLLIVLIIGRRTNPAEPGVL